MQFLHALASAGEFKSTDRFCRLARKTFACTSAAREFRQRAKRMPFKIQGGYFGFCRISLNTEKDIILPINFCKGGGLTRLYCSLTICDKITRLKDVLLRCFWQYGVLELPSHRLMHYAGVKRAMLPLAIYH